MQRKFVFEFRIVPCLLRGYLPQLALLSSVFRAKSRRHENAHQRILRNWIRAPPLLFVAMKKFTLTEKMKRLSLALRVLLFGSAAAYGQSMVSATQLSINDRIVSQSRVESEATDEGALAAAGITALKRLEKDVLIYRSLGEFESNGKLARVSFEVFQKDLQEVTAEVEPILARLPQGKLKTEISNALASYQDGAYWWQQINQPRVVHVSALKANEFNRTPSETTLLSSVPYTVAIHWRQAGRYLRHAQGLMAGTQK